MSPGKHLQTYSSIKDLKNNFTYFVQVIYNLHELNITNKPATFLKIYETCF